MIDLQHVTFGYDEQTIFEDMSVTFDESWKLALVGRNGRGKTTLMKLLLGELAFSGQIHSDKAFIYFPQSVADPTMLTKYVLDELYDAPDWQIQRELNLLDFPLDSLWRPFESLSGGEQTKVLLAGLFLDEGNFPLIDEPTNHLDLASRAKIAQYLQSKKTGYIVSSHDRQFLNVVSDHLLAIERQDITLLATNFSTYELEKKRRDHFELAENEKLKSEISRLKQTAREKAEWSRDRERDKYGNPNQKGSGAIGGSGFIGARAARMMKKAKVLEHRMTSEIAEKEKLLKNLEKVDQLAMHYQPSHHQVLLFEEELTVTFDGKALFSPIKLGQKAREITAITGPNGVGKSQLLQQLIASAEKRQLRISCVRQLYGDNQGSLKSFADKHGLDYPDFLNNLRKLGMPREAFSKKIEQLSMGQQKKVELAKSLATPAELFIWDEPLNYLDVFNQEQIEVLLQTVKPAMLIVEHDAQFIENVADQVIELKTSED